MREYGKVHSSFWTDDTLSFLSNDARLLALYLLTGPHANSIGCFRLPNGYISADLFEAEKQKQAPKRTERALLELEDSGFIHRDQKNGWTLICNFLRYNPPENGNVGIRMAKDAAKVPKTVSFFDEFLSVLKTVEYRLPEGFMKGFGNGSGNGIANGIATPEPEPEPEYNTKRASAQSNSDFARIFEAAELDIEGLHSVQRDQPVVESWFKDGITADMACSVISEIMNERKSSGREPPFSLKFYDKPVREVRDGITRRSSMQSPKSGKFNKPPVGNAAILAAASNIAAEIVSSEERGDTPGFSRKTLACAQH